MTDGCALRRASRSPPSLRGAQRRSNPRAARAAQPYGLLRFARNDVCGTEKALAQRRERRRNAERIFLVDQDVGDLGLGRPDALGDRFGADARPLGGVLVGPDMDI